MKSLMQDSVPGTASYRRFLPFVFLLGLVLFLTGFATFFAGLDFSALDEVFAGAAFAAGALGAGCATGSGGATATAAFPFFLPATGAAAAG
jgi:hypothetical protein